MANFIDRGKPEFNPRESPEAKKGLVARWFRPGFLLSTRRQGEGLGGADLGATGNGGDPGSRATMPRVESPRTSWEEVLKQRRETAELEFRRRQQEEQERTRMLWSHAASGEMGVEQALEGLGPGAGEPEIRAAHELMMNCKHPDVRNSEFLVKLVDAARDILLRRAGSKS